ncbi:hypothetical protein BCV69DRAFT_280048 [Microstroma glucosiphilum]|uniref:Zn(2)-C6 fungal-type domain-containing protein n=1 Tax=Pseudomicrostroma glucosiphilum TaxID=1684307 RepID=A0A316UFW7_9BASI|nr:hypothetical protein BCV69DRAFT_280048 [Pseudomicrostroma glucosiphilum]PWN24146.1 hypothetical protein BCV69DRAFT_280048 [Pseudomicrostroma glucosiphilum]
MDPSSFLGGFASNADGAAGPSSSSSSSPWQPSYFATAGTSNDVPADLLRWYQEQQMNQAGAQPRQNAQASQPPPFQSQSFGGGGNQNYNFNMPSASTIKHEDKQDSHTGPIRQKTSGGASSSSGPIKSAPSADDEGQSPDSSKAGASGKAAPVRAACLFCRARKSRCNGQHPCHNCINRGREDDCIYTVSRRGGKPKPKPNQSQEEANLEQHLKRLFSLSQLPQQVRVPGAIPQLRDAQLSQEQETNAGGAGGSKNSGNPMPRSLQQPQPPAQQNQQLPQASQMPFLPSSGHQMMASQSPYSAPSMTQSPPNPMGMSANAGPQWDSMAALYSAMNDSYGLNLMPNNMNASPATSNPAALGQPPDPSHQRQQTQQEPSPTSAWPVQQQQQQQPLRQSIPSQQQTPLSSAPATGSDPPPGFPPRASVYTILLGYYNTLYRFIPVFAPPQHIHEMSQRLSLDSPFILALQAILPLLQDGESTSAYRSQGASSGGQAFAAGFGIGPGNSGLNFPTSERKAELLAITSHYEKRATETIEHVLEQAESQLQGSSQPLTNKGTTIGVIQALAVLCVYHYGSGRALKARLKADQALGLAMAKGLHRLRRPRGDSPNAMGSKSSFVSSDDVFGTQSLYSQLPEQVRYEMEKRIWWTCWSSSLWCSYNTAIAPTIRADDPRVRTEMPTAQDPTVWPANIRSLQSLLLIQERVLALAHFKDGGEGDGEDGAASRKDDVSLFSPQRSSYAQSSNGRGETPAGEQAATFSSLPNNASRQDVLDSMLEIDRSLQEQITQIEADEASFKQLCQEPASASMQGEESLSRVDDDLAMYLKRSAAIQLYTSSLTLHLGQAFQGASLFERKLCFLNTVTESDPSAACQVPMPDSFSSAFGFADGTEGDNDSGEKGQGGGNIQASPAGANAAALGQEDGRASTSAQDLFARGPFLPKDSLGRCVHASKRLLEIARSKRKEPNPFNACSYVLISFTLLMQALAVSSSASSGSDSRGNSADADGEGEEDAETDGDDYEGDYDMSDFLAGVSSSGGGGEGDNSLWTNQGDATAPNHADFSAFSRGLLQSAQGAAALGGSGSSSQQQTPFEVTPQAGQQPPWDFSAPTTGTTTGTGGLSNNDDLMTGVDGSGSGGGQDSAEAQGAAQRRREKLREIWSRVREAHATLKELSKYWKMVEPMADEVSLCLETSQLLLQQ